MYDNFFGFREKPFKLVPDPSFLFLSKSHEEALAYLNYAVAEGIGFVQITGEVGTGKTTLCRYFLENLHEQVVAAYIFNPKLGPKQLIKVINDELGVAYDVDNTKDLTDRLNEYLLRQHADGRRVVLLIDEAQQLRSDVLEQLRLLSNLETATDKLLQIILVGQPELNDVLTAYNLRQISQRIALRCDLLPLTRKETAEYIHYRVELAANSRKNIFKSGALDKIYRHTGGIPRLINIACDRALLTAYGLNTHEITGTVAKAAIAELADRNVPEIRKGRTVSRRPIALAALLMATVIGAIVYQMFFTSSFLPTKNEPVPASAPPASAQDTEKIGNKPTGNTTPIENKQTVKKPLPAVDTAPPTDAPAAVNAEGMAEPAQRILPLVQVVDAPDHWPSRDAVLSAILSQWPEGAHEERTELSEIEDSERFFTLAAAAGGFSLLEIRADLRQLVQFNLPAILEFHPSPLYPSVYLPLLKAEGDRLFFGLEKDAVAICSVNDLSRFWTGKSFLLWRNFWALSGNIPTTSEKDAVMALKLLLKRIGYSHLNLSSEYDDQTQAAIMQIQAHSGIPVDGIVGPMTKIMLYRLGEQFSMPTLVSGQGASESVRPNVAERQLPLAPQPEKKPIGASN